MENVKYATVVVSEHGNTKTNVFPVKWIKDCARHKKNIHTNLYK